MRKELKIRFESLLSRGIQVENQESVEEKGLVFSEIYSQAQSMIDNILEKTRKYFSLQYKDKNIFNTFEQNEISDIQNIIAFTGRRGTGKTSAMLSFAHKLQSSEKNIYKCFNKYINASVMEDNEDIFLIVLSYIYSLLESERKKFEYNKNALYTDIKEKLANIYEYYISLKNKPYEQLSSSYSMMAKLSNKYSVRDKFADLVEDLNNLFCSELLVICIDDIDMTQKHSVNIMRCINQYLMQPGIAVLVTMDFEILEASIKKSFFESFNTCEGSDKQEENSNLIISAKQTNEFLRKVIPSDMRITMPSWRKKDYRELNPYVVSFGEDFSGKRIVELLEDFEKLEDSVIFEKLKEKDNKKNKVKTEFTLSPKELVLMMLAERTGIYLDVKGSKYHFFEPDSLRKLYDSFYLLYHMNNISSINIKNKRSSISEKGPKTELEIKEKFLKERNENRKILLDYFYFSLKPDYRFSSDVEKIIRRFLEEPIERRGKRIWDYYFQCINRPDVKALLIANFDEKFYEEENKKNNVENYSLGEVYRIFFYGSRAGILDRKLIHFFLASFSLSLPQFVESEKYYYSYSNDADISVIDSRRKNPYKKLREVFQYTLLGTWNRELFSGSNVNAVIYIDEFKLNIKNASTEAEKKEILKKLIRTLIYLLMMSSRSTRDTFDVAKKVITDVNANGTKKKNAYVIENRIDPTAFIMNSLRFTRRIRDMKFKLNETENFKDSKIIVTERSSDSDEIIYSLSILLNEIIITELSVDQIQNIIGKDDSLKKVINDLVKKVMEELEKDESFNKKVKVGARKEKTESNTLWFMLKNTDLSYNVIKRSVSDLIYISDINLNRHVDQTLTPYQIIQKVYDRMYKKLREEDEVYFVDDYNEKFSKLFFDNTIVRLFTKDGEKIIDSQNRDLTKYSEDSFTSSYSSTFKYAGIESDKYESGLNFEMVFFALFKSDEQFMDIISILHSSIMKKVLTDIQRFVFINTMDVLILDSDMKFGFGDKLNLIDVIVSSEEIFNDIKNHEFEQFIKNGDVKTSDISKDEEAQLEKLNKLRDSGINKMTLLEESSELESIFESIRSMLRKIKSSENSESNKISEDLERVDKILQLLKYLMMSNAGK